MATRTYHNHIDVDEKIMGQEEIAYKHFLATHGIERRIIRNHMPGFYLIQRQG